MPWQDSKCPKLVEKWYDFGRYAPKIISFTIEISFLLSYIPMQMSKKCKCWLQNTKDFFSNRSMCKLDDGSFFNRLSYLLRASEWCFSKTPNVQSWLKNDMILGATRPKSYHLQLKFPFCYRISQCKCPKNANVGSKIQSFFFQIVLLAK